MKTIRTMDLNECAAYLREHGLSISNESLAAGLEQRVYPFGVCIRGGKLPNLYSPRGRVDRGTGGVSMDGYTMALAVIGAVALGVWFGRALDWLEGKR